MLEEVMIKEISDLKREIKRAKLFEVQRLVRRLRQLANKKGSEALIKKNQRKIERFEKELEFLKDMGVDEIARRIASKNEEDGDDEQAIKDKTGKPHVDTNLSKRALDRVVNSTKIKQFLKRVDASSKDYDHSKREKRSIVAEVTRTEKQEKFVKGEPKSRTSTCRVSDIKTPLNEESEDDENGNVLNEKVSLKRQRKPTKRKGKAVVSVEKPSFQLNDDEDELNSDGETSRVKTKQKSAKQKAFKFQGFATELLVGEKIDDVSDGFISNSDLDVSDFEESGEGSDDISSPVLKPKGLESCFVETMSGLKGKKGLMARTKQGRGKGKLGKRNRKGQRARQQMWEKIHGKRAKHLQKNKTVIKPKDEKEDRKQTSKVKGQHSVKQKNDNESLHPSWEAMKRKRLQETVKVEFKGQKIKFDDSD